MLPLYQQRFYHNIRDSHKFKKQTKQNPNETKKQTNKKPQQQQKKTKKTQPHSLISKNNSGAVVFPHFK